MGAVPKKKLTTRRQNNRASHFSKAPVSLAPCPQCGSPRLPHRVCATCGVYRGKQVLHVEEGQQAEA